MIHRFKFDEFFFVLDIASGSIHVVDETVYDILGYMPDCTQEEITEKVTQKHPLRIVTECFGEIQALIEDGLLFSQDAYADISPSQMGRPIVKALCMHMAHDCNLACAYCFGAGGSFCGKRELMPSLTAKASIDFLLANCGGRENLEVDFFGGEPLLNLDVIKETVAYARKKESEAKKRIHFTLTTNGLLLDDETNEYINREIDNVVLSLDGRKSVNDSLRKTINGGGSYDIAAPKLLALALSRNGKDYYARGTYTANNLDFTADVMHLADIGFKHISVEPVVLTARNPLSITEPHLEHINSEYETLAHALLEREDINFFHFNIDTTGGPCVYKRLKGCGAGSEYLAVTPSGELYPCHQFVGNKQYRLGDIHNGITNTKAAGVFSGLSVCSNNACKDCWARYYCGGGCAANAVTVNGTPFEPYDIGCRILKKRTECAIAYNYLMTIRSPINGTDNKRTE